MKDYDYWERFEQTGSITDYLNYTACTSEVENQNIENGYTGSDREGGARGRNYFNWHGTFHHANWRLR